eukprot:gene3413-5958_t
MGNTHHTDERLTEKSVVTQKQPEKIKRNWYLEAQQIQSSFRDEEQLQKVFLSRLQDVKLKTLDLSRMGRLLFDQNDFEVPLSLNDKIIQNMNTEEIKKIDISFTLFSKSKRTVDEFPKEIFLIQQLKEANRVQFPTEILQFTYLKELIAVGCDIAELPNEISSLKFLEKLDLSSNSIGKLPEEFYELKYLKFLNLSKNSFETKFNEKFSGFVELIELDLSHLNLSSFPNLSKMKKLKKFRAQFFPIQLKKIEEFPKFPTSIKSIDLRLAKFTEFPDLSNLIDLEYLDLGFGDISSIPDTISKLSSLTYLNLFGNQISSLPKLPTKLKYLILRSNKITKIPAQIYEMKNLEIFDISMNELTKIEPLSNLINLKSLNISYNKLTSIPEISKEVKLERFIFCENPLKEKFSFSPSFSYPFKKCDLTNDLVDRIKGCIYGQALGDAIGLLTEFFPKNQSFKFYGIENLSSNIMVVDRHRNMFIPGDFTDDTDQMICILDSVISKGKFDSTDFAKRLFAWVFRGFYMLGDSAGAGLGQTVKNTITRENFLNDPHKASEYVWEQMHRNAAANGAIMRTSITGVFDFDDTEKVISNTKNMAMVTHFDSRCVQSSILISTIISLILKYTKEKKEIEIDNLLQEALKLIEIPKEHEADFDRYLKGETFEDLELDEPSKIGYTLKAMGCGVVGLKQAKNLDVKKAFKLILSDLVLESGDADSNGCVCGAVLGTYVGYSNLPKEWIDELIHKQFLDEKIEELLDFMKKENQL